jgi:ADP-heptose:LPS heptosyltransferase
MGVANNIARFILFNFRSKRAIQKKIIILTWGGLGDILVCIPTFKALKQHYPQSKLIVYCTKKIHFPVLKHNPYVDSIRFLAIKSLWRYPVHFYYYIVNRNKVKYTPLFFPHILPSIYINNSVKDIVAQMFNISLNNSNRNIQLFFTEKEQQRAKKMLQPHKITVLLHIHSKSTDKHHWEMKKWIELVKELPEFTFIQIGHKNEPYVAGTIDWRGKTSLRVALCLLKYCSSFVGVDSVFAHATNAFNTPGVVLFGDSSPAQAGHENNINIYKNLRCSPCYYYLWGNPCPYDNNCMKQITVVEVKAALLAQVNVSQSRKSS